MPITYPCRDLVSSPFKFSVKLVPPTLQTPLAEAPASFTNIDPSLQVTVPPADTPTASEPGLLERSVRNPVTLFQLDERKYRDFRVWLL